MLDVVAVMLSAVDPLSSLYCVMRVVLACMAFVCVPMCVYVKAVLGFISLL